MGKGMKLADGRPRVHLWQFDGAWNWSIGPVGKLVPASTPGNALDAAISQLGKQAAGGVVAIVENHANHDHRS